MFRFGDPGGRGYNAVGTSNANQLAWWTGPTFGTNLFSVQSGGGRTIGSSLRLTVSGAGVRYMSVNLSSQATWGIAFGFRINTGLPTSSLPIWSLYDGSTSQCVLWLLADGTLLVQRGTQGSGTNLGQTSVSLTVGAYYHIEWKTVINNSTGTVDLRINGVSALSLTGQNTRASANNSASIVYIGNIVGVSTTSGTILDFDDVIIYDGQTTDPAGHPDISDFIGDCGLTWLLPSGAGTTTQFTPDTGSNFARVNEATPDGDTSYVSDATVNHIDTYAIANLPANITTVKSLAVVNYARKDDVGSRSFAPEIRTNSANFDGVTQALGNSYLYYFSNWGQNPSGTPANWTPTDVNNLEAGQKVIS